MHNLLTQGKQPEIASPYPQRAQPESRGRSQNNEVIPPNSRGWNFILKDMQEELQSIGIIAEREDLIDALGASLSLRMDLVRYLIASYLTDNGSSGNPEIQRQTRK